MTTRYGQLSYTSFETVGRPGGWHVKETAGGITDAEARMLVSRIRVTLDPITPLPAYPTADELRSFPRRLAFCGIDETTAAYWHTAPAGPDSTGRPGNVFAHALLDRDASETTNGFRPIELWRSPQWLAPYGAPAVGAAVLADDPPGPGGVVTAESVLGFVCDATVWRLGVLCVLLDAVAAALNDGPTVMLGVETSDVAAQWIGLVSFLMSPGTARRLSFSTFDRSRDLTHLAWPGPQLLAVPRGDLDAAPAGVVVIDDADILSLGEFHGQPHRTRRGQKIEATAWSAMVQVALTDPADAEQLLTDIDEVSSATVDYGLPPALPMAVSVLNSNWGQDAVVEAQSVLAGGPAAAGMYRSR